MTISEWAQQWMENDVCPKVRPTTYAAKRYILQNHILSKLGGIPLDCLTEKMVGTFLDERKRCGSSRPESADYPGLSDVTMRHIHRNLQECLDRAVDAGLMVENPARAFHYATKRKATANVLSNREIDDYLDAAEELGLLPMFALMLTVGLRQRELLALKWSDLDENTGMLSVAEERVVVKGTLVDYGGVTREISLTVATVALLRQEHDRHPSSELMFMHPGTQKPFTPAMVRMFHQRIIEKAGLEPLRFEDLRHTAAVHALQNGDAVGALSVQLGHSRPSMTRQLYADYLPKNDGESVGKQEQPTDIELQKAADQLGTMLKF
ncbi:MAG: site-specific integrase [Clostridia bacterium]